jgi:hypothetical protein
MNKLYNLIILASILMLTVACPDRDYAPDSTLLIKNNSKDTLLYFIEFKSIVDTVLPSYNLFPDESTKSTWLIFPYSESRYKDAFIKTFNELDNKVLMVFIFDAKVLETTPWDTVKAKYLVLKRYDLSLQDLEDMNWTITYP